MLWDGVVAGIPPSQRQAINCPTDYAGGARGATMNPLKVQNGGEHTNSFYVWEKFMEGAALSGIDAANAILRL